MIHESALPTYILDLILRLDCCCGIDLFGEALISLDGMGIRI